MEMKKRILLCAAGLLAYGAQAQTTKGTIVLTGSIGYIQQKTEQRQENELIISSEWSNRTVSPSIGLFIKDNLEVGASFHRYRQREEYNYQSTRNDFGHNRINLENSFSLYATQYKYLTDKLAVYGRLSAGGGIGKTEDNLSSMHRDASIAVFRSKNNVTAIRAALSPGITFFPSDKVGLDASLGALVWQHRKVKRTTTTIDEYYTPESPHTVETPYTNNIFALDFSSMNLRFGISYFLAR